MGGRLMGNLGGCYGGGQVGRDTHLLVWMCAGEGKFSTPSSVFCICISCMSIVVTGVGAFAIVIMHSCDFFISVLQKEIISKNSPNL